MRSQLGNSWTRPSLAVVALGVGAMLLLAGCVAETAVVTVPTAAPSATATLTLTETPVPTTTDEPTSVPTPRTTSTTRPTATATPTPTPRPRPTALPLEALATQYPELAPLLNNPEVHSVYKELAVAYAQDGQEGALAVAERYGLLTAEGDIRVDLTLDGPVTEETIVRLQSMGIEVLQTQDNRAQIAVSQALLMSGAAQPGEALNQLSGIEHVTALLPPQV
jgi:hypothetical protein